MGATAPLYRGARLGDRPLERTEREEARCRRSPAASACSSRRSRQSRWSRGLSVREAIAPSRFRSRPNRSASAGSAPSPRRCEPLICRAQRVEQCSAGAARAGTARTVQSARHRAQRRGAHAADRVPCRHSSAVPRHQVSEDKGGIGQIVVDLGSCRATTLCRRMFDGIGEPEAGGRSRPDRPALIRREESR